MEIGEKKQVIEAVRSGTARVVVARTFKVSPSTVTRIMEDEARISNTLDNTTQKRRPILYPELDVLVHEWVDRQLDLGVQNRTPVILDVRAIHNEAQNIAAENGMDIIVHRSWVSRFIERHGLSSREISGEALSVNPETVQTWLDVEWPALASRYQPCDIFNADETGLCYRTLPHRTLAYRRMNVVGAKSPKDRITVLLAVSMLGEKRRPVVVGKFARPHALRNQTYDNVRYVSSPAAWMTRSLFRDELRDWDAELRSINRRILLIVDNVSTHKNLGISLTNIELAYFPPNTTSMLQPLDAGVIRSFKAHYLHQLSFMQRQMLNNGLPFLPNMHHALTFTVSSWAEVSQSCITNCFRHVKLTQDPSVDSSVERILEQDADEGDSALSEGSPVEDVSERAIMNELRWISSEVRRLFSTESDFLEFLKLSDIEPSDEREDPNPDTNEEELPEETLTTAFTVNLPPLKELCVMMASIEEFLRVNDVDGNVRTISQAKDLLEKKRCESMRQTTIDFPNLGNTLTNQN